LPGPESIQVYEVGPRDGLQNEAARLPTTGKLRLIELLAAARPAAVEVTSFVRPDRIPQLADADALAAELAAAPFLPSARREGVRFTALVPNLRGFERFQASQLDGLALFLSVSEGHNRANLNASVAESMENARQVVEAARASAVPVRCYLSTAFGCPFEGRVAPEKVLDLVDFFAALGVDQVVLGDTIGVAHPRQVAVLCEGAQERLPAGALGLHLHDTYGSALANALAGWETGVALFDAAVGGVGGCPYAPGASGNLATGDLVRLFEGMGVACGVDPDKLLAAGRFLEESLGRRLPGRVHRARLGSSCRL